MSALCESLLATKAFTGYAHGDPLPIYARFVGEDSDDVTSDSAVTVYIQCERESGHPGRHVAQRSRAYAWTDAEAAACPPPESSQGE